MNTKYYPSQEECKLCISCWYARQRRDICGIYCTKGFVKDGKCDHYEHYKQHRASVRNAKAGGGGRGTDE